MDRDKLLQNPLPIDGVAARVTKAAKATDLWAPKPKHQNHFVEAAEVLRTAPLPAGAARDVLSLPGKRRGRMVIVGYAAEQGAGLSTKWVVRCDCGNYEHRTKILRWLGTDATDLCRECQHRAYKLFGFCSSRDKAKRVTMTADAA